MSMRRIKTARASTRGILPSLWERLVGERDPVADQLHGLARQGTWMARLAHLCAFAMIVLFSLGSLVSIAGEPTKAFLAAWQRGQLDLNAGIAAGISAFLVLCMDVASLHAAHKLRLHAARRSPWRARLVHMATILGADVFEAGTLVYMTWRYDPPALGVVWALVIARDIAAPLYAVYLSLAQPLPVGARDVLHMVELAAGAGMARDAIRLAHDPDAPLGRKAQLFVAASETANRTTQQDLERLWYLLQVLTTTADAAASGVAVEDSAETVVDIALPPPHPHPHSHSPPHPHPPPHPPPHPHAVPVPHGTRQVGRHGEHQQAGAEQRSPRRTRQRRQSDEMAPSRSDQRVSRAEDTEEDREAGEAGEAGEAEHDLRLRRCPTPMSVQVAQAHPRSNVRTPENFESGSLSTADEEEETVLRADTGISQAIRVELRERREAVARQILSDESVISVRTFARRIEEATRSKISESTAQGLMARVRAELVREAEGAQQARQPGQLLPLPDVLAE